ncbi:MAG: hypothetical protein ACOYIF_02045 [Acetivibrionales bacterium]|jgi:hypothetical protein
MKKVLLILFLFFIILLPLGCGKRDVEDSLSDTDSIESAYEEWLEGIDPTDHSTTSTLPDESADKTGEESDNVPPFPFSKVIYDIPNSVMEIINQQPRKSNITDFIVDLGDDGMLAQSTYNITDAEHRNMNFDLISFENGDMKTSSIFQKIKENESSSKRFSSLSESVALTQRNTALQVFGDYVFMELFNKDLGKEFIGVNYKNGNVTEPIKIDDLGIDSSIIFGKDFFYYVSSGYLHRVNYKLKIDEKMFYIGESLHDYYDTGDMLDHVYNNCFSLVGNKLVFSCQAPRWIKEFDPEEGEELKWADNEGSKVDSMLKKFNSVGIEFDLNVVSSPFNFDQMVKEMGAVEHNLDMTKTGYSFYPDTKVVLSIDLTTDKFEVLSYHVGEFYKAYQLDKDIFIEASPVYNCTVIYEDYDYDKLDLPFSVQIFQTPSMENFTKTLLGDEVDSIKHSVFIPTITDEEKGYFAYAARVTNPSDNGIYLQVIKYNGKNMQPLSSNELKRCEIARIKNLLYGYLEVSNSWKNATLYIWKWNSDEGRYTWVER